MTDLDRLTVVIADIDATESQLFDLVGDWTRAGLVQDTVWVRRGTPATAPIEAILVTQEGAFMVDLSRELATRRLALLRTASAHLLDGGSSMGTSAASSDEDLRRHLRGAAAESRVPFVAGVIAIPVHGAGVPSAIFDPACEFNVIVEPEDRLGDGLMSASVTERDGPGHAVAAFIAMAGCWRFDTNGPLDDLPRSTLGNDAGVRIGRAYTRILDGGEVIDDVIDGVLRPSLLWPPPSGVNPPATVLKEPTSYVAEAADQFLTGAKLRWVAPAPTPTQQPRGVGIWAAILIYFRRLARILRSLPSAIWLDVKARAQRAAADAVQSTLYPADSEVLVTLDAYVSDGDVELDELLNALATLTLRGTDIEIANPGLWEDLRTLAFGLIDGGRLPPFIAPPGGEAPGRRVLGRPDAIAPSPHHDADFSALGLSVRCCDPVGAKRLRARMQQQSSGTGADDAQTGGRFTNWLAARQSSLLWRIGEGIDVETRAAAKAYADAWRTISQGPPRFEDARIPTFTRTALALAGGLLLVFTCPLVVWRLGAAPDKNALFTGTALLVWALATGILTSMFLKRETAAEFVFSRRANAWRDANAVAETAAQTLTLLGVTYRQMIDWAEIIGGVLHAPWGDAPLRSAERSIELEQRPLALVVAESEPDPDHVQQAVALGQRQVMSWGWMSAAYRRLASATRSAYALVVGTDDPSVTNPDVDIQPSETIVGTHTVTGVPILNSRSDLRSRCETRPIGMRSETLRALCSENRSWLMPLTSSSGR